MRPFHRQPTWLRDTIWPEVDRPIKSNQENRVRSLPGPPSPQVTIILLSLLNNNIKFRFINILSTIAAYNQRNSFPMLGYIHELFKSF